MNVCPTCQYKVISNKKFEEHKLTHQVQYPDVVEVGKVVEEGTTEPVVVVPEVPVVSDSEIITIRFTKSVEVTINGIHYDGKEIKVKDMSIASEIVRLVREAYGPTILA